MLTEFYKDKRVLVTGHTGFKGSWLCLWLQSMGANVRGYALPPPTDPSLFDLANVAGGIASTIGDVRDLDGLCSTVDDFRPDIVIHMAAQALVRESYRDPVGTYATNVMGTVNILEAVRQAGNARALVVVTSDKCYENLEWAWGYRESDRLGGHDPYSNSKGCAELVTSAYRRSFFATTAAGRRPCAVASARSGNVIGGGDFAADRLVPDLARAFAQGEKAVIRSPAAVRPWQHVLEPLSGYLLLARKLWEGDDGEFAAAWNFGPPEADVRDVQWVVQRFTELWGSDAAWSSESSNGPHEAGQLRLDCSKARSKLGWTPRLDLQTALTWTAEWYKAFCSAPSSLRDLTLRQLTDYTELGP